MAFSRQTPDPEPDEQPVDRPGPLGPGDPGEPVESPSAGGAARSRYGTIFSGDDVARVEARLSGAERDDSFAGAAEDPGDERDDEIADDADAEEEEGAGRPRIAVIIAGTLLLAVIGVALGLFFAQRGAPSDSQVIARVRSAEITRGDFLRNYQLGADPQQVLNQLIEIELIVQAAQSEGVQIDQARVDSEVAQIRANPTQGGGSEEQFQQFLKAVNIAGEADLREILGRQQLIEAMILSHTTMEQFRSRHILLTGDTPEAIAGRKAEAEELLTQIKGGADFAALAREKSDDPGSKDQGGELGWVPRGAFVPQFEEAVATMQPGELRLVETEFGWHIVQLQDGIQVRQPDDQSFLQTMAGQQAFTDTFVPWVQGLRASAEDSNQISVLIPPAQLVPTAGPAPVLPTGHP